MSTTYDYRDKGTTGMKWQKKPLSYNPPAYGARSLWIEETGGDWWQICLDFLHQILSNNGFEAMKIKRKSSRFFVKEGNQFRRGFNQAPL